MDYISEERNVVGTAELQFRCSVCNGTNVLDALRFKTTNKLLYAIPIWVAYETAVKCPDCDATFRTSTGLEPLQSLSEDQIAGHLKLRIGLVEKFLVIIGWLLIITGPVALVLFIAAWFTVPKATRGWRLATAIGLIVSTLWTAVLFLTIALS